MYLWSKCEEERKCSQACIEQAAQLLKDYTDPLPLSEDLPLSYSLKWNYHSAAGSSWPPGSFYHSNRSSESTCQWPPVSVRTLLWISDLSWLWNATICLDVLPQRWKCRNNRLFFACWRRQPGRNWQDWSWLLWWRRPSHCKISHFPSQFDFRWLSGRLT